MGYRLIFIILFLIVSSNYSIKAASTSTDYQQSVINKITGAKTILKTCSGNASNSWTSENVYGKYKVLECPVYYVKVHNIKDGKFDYISFIFSNKGDSVSMNRKSVFNYMKEKTNARDKIREDSKQLDNQMEEIFGKSHLLRFGTGKVKEKVNLWEYHDYFIILSTQNKEYASITILLKKIAKIKGNRIFIPIDFAENKLLDNIQHRPNGDIVINGIPMINQGTKGYCTPATWTRYLNYLGIYINMHNIAQKGTGAGGGSIPLQMKYTINSILSPYRLQVRLISDGTLKMKTVKKYINKGLPLVWHVPMHTRMIIGYNSKNNKIAYTDSWGKGHEEKWLSFSDARKLTTRYPLEVID